MMKQARPEYAVFIERPKFMLKLFLLITFHLILFRQGKSNVKTKLYLSKQIH